MTARMVAIAKTTSGWPLSSAVNMNEPTPMPRISSSEPSRVKIEMAMARRRPDRICGSAAGSTTRNHEPTRPVPRPRADHNSRGSMACAPWYEEMTMGIRQPTMMMTIRDALPAPHHSTKSRISAALGTG